jgi:hypothetical protein
MSKTAFGMLVGGVLGLMDGLSAWFYPEARTMMAQIIIGSTVKGIVTGGIAGWIARRLRSIAAGVGVGVTAGFALSTLAAQGQPDHFWAIVLPGMLVGAITGFATQRYRPAAATMLLLLSLVFTVPAASALEQTGSATEGLSTLDFLIGRWEGTSEGQPGNGAVQREYSRMLGSRFIEGRNRSVYPPQEKNPKGETHEDRGVFSFDRTRKRLVLRQFHVEGFVNQYVADVPAKPGVVVFTSEAIENIPAGYRARETYTVRGPDELEEVFELAEPGKEFAVYSRTILKRVAR